MADMSLFDLTGKKALVTGGAVGIGRGYATALAMAGADVAIVDIDLETAQKTCAGIREMGRESVAIRCDVTDKGQVQSMVAQVVDCFGRLDIGVNNAGIAILGGDEQVDQADWDKVIAVNLTGMFLCAQAQAQPGQLAVPRRRVAGVVAVEGQRAQYLPGAGADRAARDRVAGLRQGHARGQGRRQLGRGVGPRRLPPRGPAVPVFRRELS